MATEKRCFTLANKQGALLALETKYGIEPTDINQFDAIPLLQGSSIDVEGEDIPLDIMQPTFSPTPDMEGVYNWTFNVNLTLQGGGLDADDNAKVPVLHKLFLISQMHYKVGFVIEVSGLSSDWQYGNVVAGVGMLWGIQQVFDDDGNPTGIGAMVVEKTGDIPADGATLSIGDNGATAVVTASHIAHIYSYTTDCDKQHSASLRWNIGSNLCVSNGVVGNIDFDFSAKDKPKVTWNPSKGLFNKPVALDPSDKRPSKLEPPKVLDMNLQVGDQKMVGVKAVQIKTNAKIEADEGVNAPTGIESFYFGDRDPVLSINPQMQSVNKHNPFDKRTLAQFAARLGTEAGNRFMFIAPKVQQKKPSPTADGSMMRYNLEYKLTGDNDNEFCFVAY